MRGASALPVKLVLLVVSLAACGIPRDPEGTLGRVSGGVMRVGVTENEPWTIVDEGGPSGIEVTLVERFAEELDARIRWVDGSAEELMTALEERQLDLAIGGFVEDDPWSTKVAFTHPFAISRVVIAIRPGTEPPEDLEGIEVHVGEGSAAGGLVEDAGATPVPTADLADASGPVAVEHWRVADLGFVETDTTLAEQKHVMATQLGENAWLVRLERFLLDEAPVPDLFDRGP